jgi:hypothetical protein
VDDPLRTDDLDLDGVGTREELAALLNTVYLRADRPSLRTLEARSRRGTTPLSRTAVSEMIHGVRVPRRAAMVAFLEACGMKQDGMQGWLLAWERVSNNDGEIRKPATRPAIWHFPDGSRITLVSYRLPPDRLPPSADINDLNYAPLSALADIDTVVDIYGAIRAYNPMSQIDIIAAQDLNNQHLGDHLVLIGGLAWDSMNGWFSRIFQGPIDAGDPFDHGAIIVRGSDAGAESREFPYVLNGSELVEDVGYFIYGKNPQAPERSLTICGGITARGVHGAALCFINKQMRESNEKYCMARFPEGSTFCVVMKVPIGNGNALTPDLTRKGNRLFEWCDSDAKAE